MWTLYCYERHTCLDSFYDLLEVIFCFANLFTEKMLLQGKVIVTYYFNWQHQGKPLFSFLLNEWVWAWIFTVTNFCISSLLKFLLKSPVSSYYGTLKTFVLSFSGVTSFTFLYLLYFLLVVVVEFLYFIVLVTILNRCLLFSCLTIPYLLWNSV